MKFIHEKTKNKIEVTDPNLYSMLKREGFAPEGGREKLETKEKPTE